MSKKICVITTSLHGGSNSEALADAFIRGAVEAGASVQKIGLADKRIEFCRGCLICQKTQKCVIHDDVYDMIAHIKAADVLVFASPVYFYSVSGQMKTLLDRLNPMFPSEYAFREVYLLLASAEKDETAAEGSIKDIEGFVSCFDQVELKGVLHAGGVSEGKDIMERPNILGKAYRMGKAV